jgi:hypothetical protein
MKKVIISDEAKEFILDKLKKAGEDKIIICFQGFA